MIVRRRRKTSMKTKSFLNSLLILFGLATATMGAFFLLRLFPGFGEVPAPDLPPLSRLDLPSQTMNGITAQLESYYADASRLVFVVRVNNEKEEYFLDSISIKGARGEEINAGYGL